MATSGVRTFTPQFADLMTEAFSRVQIRPANVTQEHIDNAIMSANLLLTEFSNRAVNQYQLVQQSVALVDGTASYNLPAGTVDVWHAVVRKDDQDTPVWPMSRSDYHSMPNKDNEGRPFAYFADRSGAPDATRTITLWPVPDGTSADTLELWLWREAETVVKVNETFGVGRPWFDAYAAGLAKRLARKYAPSLMAELTMEAEEAFMFAKAGDRERAPTRLRMSGYISRGRVV